MYISVEELQFLHETRRLNERELEQYFHSPMDCIKFLLEEYPKDDIEDLKSEIRGLQDENRSLEDDVSDLERHIADLENQVKLLEKGR